jgi:hypothetical protein
MLKYSIGETDPTWCELMRQVTRLEQLKHFPIGGKAKQDLGAALAECDSLDEVRDLIGEFVSDARAGQECPMAGDLREMIKQRHSRTHPPEPVFKPEPRPANYCKRCDGSGIIGGLAFGPPRLCCPATWCDCVRANNEREKNPDHVNTINATREKLIRRAASTKKHAPATVKTDLEPAAEVYHGDF